MPVLVILPTQETKTRLQAIFMNAPYSIDFETLLVPLAYVDAILSPPVNTIVTAKVTAFKIMTNAQTNESELVALLESEQMRQRSIELGMNYDFEHKLIVLPFSPAQSTTVRNFNVSIADTLVSRESTPFTFQREIYLK